MASKKSFVKGALILTFAGVLAKVLGALYRIPFNRIVGEEGAALYALGYSLYLILFALSTAEKYISSGMYQRGIVIGSETLSKVLDWSDRSTSVLFGDGAGGVLLEVSDQKTFLAENLYTDGSRGNSLESCYLGLSSPYSDEVSDRKYLTMDGRAVFDFAIRDVTKSIQKMIADASMEAEEIDYFLLHQANDRMLDKMSKKLGVSREKIPANMMEYGNTSAASIPILLSECVENHRIKMDGSQKILLTGFGGGLTWGTLLVTI